MDDRIELVSGGLINIVEAEKISGLKKSFLYGRMATGDLVYVKIGGARRIPRKALLQFLAEHLVTPREEGAATKKSPAANRAMKGIHHEQHTTKAKIPQTAE